MPALLLRYLPHIAIAVAVIAGVWWFSHARYTAGYEAATATMRAELDKERELRRQTDWKVRQDYEARIAELNANAARELRGRPIRCVLGNTGQVRAGSNPSGSAGSAAGEPAVQPAADIRSSIVQRGTVCEQLRQQLIAIKSRQDQMR